jgi:RNA polymerase sigma factor (sigma-70 family)
LSTTTAAVEAVWRIESGRLIATLARITGDLPTAEDLAQDAFEVALRQWPRDGIPDNPAAWLTATAKHIAVDHYRRRLNLNRLLPVVVQVQASREEEEDPMAQVDNQLTTPISDGLLRLIFTACHPVLTLESQVALTLRTLGGLQTREIARAFLVSEATMGQRISRAKKTLTEHRVRFELPSAAEVAIRFDAVLAVIYFIFNEGYSATGGDDWTRPTLCHDALRLGRVLAVLRPEEPEVHGLVALMELQTSRIAARTMPGGDPVLLADQDRRRWDTLLIRRGLAALQRAEDLGGGPYTLGVSRTPTGDGWPRSIPSWPT